jgi:hypothetical protein
MFGVDKGDQIRVQGGGFSNKAHFKKWYKKTYLAILDCMMMNSLIAWNMAAARQGTTKEKLLRHQFMSFVAEEFMDYEDQTLLGDSPRMSPRRRKETCITDHHMVTVRSGTRCAVCRMELNMNPSLGQEGLSTNIVQCLECRIPVHSIRVEDSNRQIHQLPQFQGLSCFAIIHTEDGQALWKCHACTARVSFSPVPLHPIFIQLREFHGLSGRKKRKNSAV